ncbi:threonine/homoserine efflux transporter RhtA [Trinickia symbiotica]|uniref:EamA/RhaT family transporter n=1 Tax=Trinickia symbiotica TaxID=863227 RepID=A0A2N7X3A4_9BURK|nr:DMT family transporter [Trinickia symbiotica]PMS36032.1 EamA/RhaT family transporter [Trinickia symbiotica]PPK45704.1 threonine/homoserine efflux transporter RhtA [Trinickia symbiotica]
MTALSASSRTETLFGALLVAVSASAFGAMPIFGRYAYAGGTDVLGLLTLRFGIGGIILGLVAKQRGVVWPRGRALAFIAAMGAFGYFGQSLCYFIALQHAQASLVALLLYLYPAFVTLLAAMWLDERLTRVKCAALVLCLAGSALMVGGGHGEPLGIALGFAAAIVYSLYIVIGARVTRGVDPLATTAVVCLAAAAMFSMLSIARAAAGMPPHWPGTSAAWAAVIGIALLSTVAAMLAFFGGLARLGAARTSMLSTLEPVVTVTLASLLLGETLGWLQWMGGASVLGAVLWLVRSGGGARDEAVSLEANQ